MQYYLGIARHLLISSWLWISLGVGSFILRSILQAQPHWVEAGYSRGLFLFIRTLMDYTIGLIPLPWIYMISGLIIYLLIRSFRPLFRKKIPIRKRIESSGLRLLALLGGGYFFFLTLWGYNYIREPLEDQMAFVMEPLGPEELWQSLEDETELLVRLRYGIPSAGPGPIQQELSRGEMERALREGVGRWLMENGFPAPGRVRGRLIYPKGSFLRFSSAGMYFPFSGEGYIDAGLHPLQIPPVMAHELGHAYGFGDEGTCNFLSYMGCLASNDPYLQYTGQLNYWRTLAVNCRRNDPERYQEFRRKLPEGIQADLDAINAYLMKYPDIMPQVRNAAYTSYLKAQGIEEGMANYNRVLMLVKAWKQVRRS